jgi:anti-sigma regulatory factor (Ser/Thr protein kinase)
MTTKLFDIFSRPSLTLQIPHTFKAETMYPFIATAIDCDRLEPKCSRLEFDFSNLKFIEPIGVVVLSNTIEWLRKRQVKMQFINHRTNTPANKFLDDSQFFSRYLDKEIRPYSDPRSTTVPLQLIKHAGSFVYIENLINWLSERLHLSKATLSGLKVCLQELFNNIKDHASEDTGCIFVQHHPKPRQIKIVVSDFGVGIPANVRTIIANISDGDAIKKATEEGFTTKPGGRNRGAGLDILTLNVVKTNQGTVHIHSLNGIFSAFPGGTGIQTHIKASRDGTYPGTLIQLMLRTDTFDPSIADEENFEWS